MILAWESRDSLLLGFASWSQWQRTPRHKLLNRLRLAFGVCSHNTEVNGRRLVAKKTRI
jgi:hypothetical protein